MCFRNKATFDTIKKRIGYFGKRENADDDAPGNLLEKKA